MHKERADVEQKLWVYCLLDLTTLPMRYREVVVLESSEQDMTGAWCHLGAESSRIGTRRLSGSLLEALNVRTEPGK